MLANFAICCNIQDWHSQKFEAWNVVDEFITPINSLVKALAQPCLMPLPIQTEPCQPKFSQKQ